MLGATDISTSMHVTIMRVAVAPDHHLLEQKENQNPAQYRERDMMRVHPRYLEGMRQDGEK